MPTSNARSTAEGSLPDGTRGPEDDFFCHKYQVWYRIKDCVYRGKNRTFSGCVNCFQGYLNIRSLDRGIKPPGSLGPHSSDAASKVGPSGPGALLPFASPTRDSRNGTGA